MDAMDLIDREYEPIGIPICDQQAGMGFDQRLARRDIESGPLPPYPSLWLNLMGRGGPWGERASIFDSEQAAQRDANQEFAANIDQAQDDPLPSVRQRMNQAALSHFLEGLGRQ